MSKPTIADCIARIVALEEEITALKATARLTRPLKPQGTAQFTGTPAECKEYFMAHIDLKPVIKPIGDGKQAVYY